jgi:hypothetical protein
MLLYCVGEGGYKTISYSMVAYDPTPYNLYCVTLSLQLDNVEHVFVKEVSAKLTKIATDNENFFTLSKKIDVARIEVFADMRPWTLANPARCVCRRSSFNVRQRPCLLTITRNKGQKRYDVELAARFIAYYGFHTHASPFSCLIETEQQPVHSSVT